jgi:hypothetical protein
MALIVVEPADMSSFLYNSPHASEFAHNENSAAESGKLESKQGKLVEQP